MALICETADGAELPEEARSLPRLKLARRLPARLSGYEDAFAVRTLLERTLPRLYHSLEYSLPLNASCRLALTVHDLIPWLFEGGYTRQRIRWWLQRRLARRADLLLCVSRSTGDDVQRLLRPRSARVVPVHSGVDHEVFAPPPEAVVEEARRRFSLEEGYYLYVGEFDRRKNPGPAMAAIASLRQGGHNHVQLAMVGRTDPYRVRLELEMERFAGEGVRLLGHLPRQDVVALYGGARALLHTSLYEGFGLTILEAMACGCPVIAFANSAVPEVTDDAALLVRGGEDQFVEAVLRFDADPAQAERLRPAGLARAQHFRWDNTAAAVAASYAAALA
jgi:alpha-1,3-rhamnosyl/mannosyltransferase